MRCTHIHMHALNSMPLGPLLAIGIQRQRRWPPMHGPATLRSTLSNLWDGSEIDRPMIEQWRCGGRRLEIFNFLSCQRCVLSLKKAPPELERVGRREMHTNTHACPAKGARRDIPTQEAFGQHRLRTPTISIDVDVDQAYIDLEWLRGSIESISSSDNDAQEASFPAFLAGLD